RRASVRARSIGWGETTASRDGIRECAAEEERRRFPEKHHGQSRQCSASTVPSPDGEEVRFPRSTRRERGHSAHEPVIRFQLLAPWDDEHWNRDRTGLLAPWERA